MAPRSGPRDGRIVTLTSDVGAAYAAQMKGVLIVDGVPPGQIVDLSHDLPAHDVAEAAFLLREMARGYPPGSVHVAVIDPGVGGRRLPIAIVSESGTTLIGPDNGVLYPLAQELGVRAVYRIDRDRVGRAGRVGTTFDGRDLFAPAAARVLSGVPPSELGPPVPLHRAPLPTPRRLPDGAQGEVLHVDRFGNVITNLPSRWMSGRAKVAVVAVGSARFRNVPVVASYEALDAGALGVLGSSFGLIEVAVGRGRAADRMRCRPGSPVAFRWSRERPTPGETANSARPRKRR